jgi:hypothetical protein
MFRVSRPEDATFGDVDEPPGDVTPAFDIFVPPALLQAAIENSITQHSRIAETLLISICYLL